MSKLYIIEPWFTGQGHPAQSLLNTARGLRNYKNIQYIVSKEKCENNQFQSFYDGIKQLAPLETFTVSVANMQSGTRGALAYLLRKRRYFRDDIILFFDMHLVTVAFFWFFLGSWIHLKRLGLLYLKGPERIASYSLIRWFVKKLLQNENIVLFLRTQELTDAWRKAFPEVAAKRIKTLPSLELPSVNETVNVELKEDYKSSISMHFGVVGQVREGKGLDWLVPYFQDQPDRGVLTVAGTFCNEQERLKIPCLEGFSGFQDAFLSESEMLQCAACQDYLLLLYDKWDARMESAVLYLAAKVGCPVVAYDEGWCGRMIREFDCGILVSKHEKNPEVIFESLPKLGSKRYQELSDGMNNFAKEHSGEVIAAVFMRAVEE